MTKQNKNDEAHKEMAGEASWTARQLPKESRLRRDINRVGPATETAAGVQYFHKVLTERGPSGLLDTLARFRKMLDEGDGLDLAEMKKHEQKIYHKVPPPVFNRRIFLGSSAWGLVGMSAIGGSVLKTTDHVHSAITPANSDVPKNDHGHPAHDASANYAKQAHAIYERHVIPYESLIVGAALVNEGIEKWEVIRLRQIKDTVLRLGEIPADTLAKCNKAELAQKIDKSALGDKHKDWVAQQFLQELLKQKGESALLGFVQRARTAIGEQNELDLEIDLSKRHWPVERKIFDAIRCDPKRLSGSDFLETWGWLIPGMMCVADGGLRVHHHHIKGAPAGEESPLIKAISSYVYDPGQFLLGASLVNEFNQNWQEIKLEQLGDTIIELKRKNIDWKKIEPLALDEIIENLDEPQEKYAGIQFLRMLLETDKGVSKVASFMERASKLLDKASAQELPTCFTAQEHKILKAFRCRPNLLDSQNFLHTVGWGLPGVICLMTGASSAANLAIRTCGGPQENVAGKMHHWIHDRLGPIEGIFIGAALLNEALEKFEEYNLGQISDAAAQLVKMTRKQGVQYK